jgi:hypothetical protein
MDMHQPRTVKEALAYTPGVRQRAGVYTYDYFYSRLHHLQTVILTSIWTA